MIMSSIKRYKNIDRYANAACFGVDDIDDIIEWLGDRLISEAREGIGCVGYWLKTESGNVMLSRGDLIIEDDDGTITVLNGKTHTEYFHSVFKPIDDNLSERERIAIQALKDVADPISKFKRELEDGEKLEADIIYVLDMPYTYIKIAQDALKEIDDLNIKI